MKQIMKRAGKVFLIFWALTFVISFFTANEDFLFLQRLAATAGLGAFAALLSLCNSVKSKPITAPSDKARKIRVIDIKAPNSSKVLYQVKNNKVYKFLNPTPIYEIKGDKVYAVNSPKVIYTLSDNKVYRSLEPTPILEINNGKICVPLSPKVIYEMQTRYE